MCFKYKLSLPPSSDTIYSRSYEGKKSPLDHPNLLMKQNRKSVLNRTPFSLISLSDCTAASMSILPTSFLRTQYPSAKVLIHVLSRTTRVICHCQAETWLPNEDLTYTRTGTASLVKLKHTNM